MRKGFLKNFLIFDLILIAMVSALTIAFKTVVGILVRMITGPLGIPGGALAGGLYMLWMPLGIALIGRRGTAFLIALIQSLVLVITSAPGSHGFWTFITYLLPAIAVELVCAVKSKKGVTIYHFIIATVFANIVGTFGSNLLFFRMSFIPLMFTLSAATLSGAVGGILGYSILKTVARTGLLNKTTAGMAAAAGTEKLPVPESFSESSLKLEAIYFELKNHCEKKPPTESGTTEER